MGVAGLPRLAQRASLLRQRADRCEAVAQAEAEAVSTQRRQGGGGGGGHAGSGWRQPRPRPGVAAAAAAQLLGDSEEKGERVGGDIVSRCSARARVNM